MSENIVVIDGGTLNPGDLSWAPLESLGRLTVHAQTTSTQVISRLHGASCVLTNKVPLASHDFERLPDLRYIGVTATGYNIIDAEAAARRGIIVTNVSTYSTDTVAQHTISLMLELARQTSMHLRAVADSKWSNSNDWCLPVAPIVELTGKTLGIVGLGRIGVAVARIAQAMGMTVIASRTRHATEAPSNPGIAHQDMDALLAASDVVSLHCPLTPQTRHLMNAAGLARMKRSAWLINTSRGQLIDSQALAEALRAGDIAAAALDVLDQEPPPADHPLLRAPNCLITPHVAWYAREARQRLIDASVANLRAYLAGRPINFVSASGPTAPAPASLT